MNGLGESAKAAPKEQLPFSLRQKGLGRDEIWKALRRTDGATGGFSPGISQVFMNRGMTAFVVPCFFVPRRYREETGRTAVWPVFFFFITLVFHF